MVSAGLSTLVVGDLHGCGEEFAELLEVARRERADARVVLVGDLFTKGPRPDLVVECIAARRALGGRVDIVCGNHDLRLLEALRRHDAGLPMDVFAGAELATIRLLERADMLVSARRLLAEAVGRTFLQGCGFTVLHAGVRPREGLAGTSDFEKVHLKAAPGETPWWELYDGRDGLLIVGHKPLFEPLMVRRAGQPAVVNVDTGCAYGGALTGYIVEEDRFLQVPSRQPPREGFTAPVVATAPQWASVGPARTFARRA